MRTRQNDKMLLGTLAQSVFLASLGTSMANLALPAIAAEFGVPFAGARWVVLGYLLATTIFSLAIGRMGDLEGRRRTLLAGTALFAGASLASTFAPTFWLLVSARVFQGVGAAALVVLPIVIATEAVPSQRNGRVIGLLATMSAVGTASGPSIGGAILASWGWRPVFLVMALLAALSLWFVFRFVRLTEIERGTGRMTLGWLAALTGVFSDPQLRPPLLHNLVVSAVMMTTLIVGPFYLTQQFHLGPFRLGLVMSAGPVTSVVSGWASGHAVDRFGADSATRLGFTLLLLGALSFACLPSWFGPVGFASSAVLLSLGYQLFLAANSSRVMRGVSPDRRGLASGGLSLSRNLGLIAGTALLGGIFDFISRRSIGLLGNLEGAERGLQAAFLSAAALLSISFVAYLLTEQRRKNGTRSFSQVH